jgi:hypothetical protein
MTAQVLVILPEREMPDYTLARIKRLTQHYFDAGKYALIFTAPKSVVGRYNAQEHFGGKVAVFDPAMLTRHEVFLVSEDLADKLPLRRDRRVYTLEHNHWQVFVRLRSQTIDARDYPAIDEHSFNRMGPKLGWDTLQFFPYGFIYRECAIGGPLDSFGFRIDEDLDALRRRPDTHKLIAVLGGSSTLSWFNFHDETFTEQLEIRLQRQLDSRGNGERVTVLNFGQGSSVLLHEMIVWLLHVERLRPQIVISHDGCNDMMYGMTNDPYLLSKSICAPQMFELWGQKLHDRDDVRPRFKHGEPVEIVNSPQAILAAYIERKRQLNCVVQASGVRHIAALQPIARSKKSSLLEGEFQRDNRYIWIWRKVHERTPQLFDMLTPLLKKETELDTFDLHEYFRRFGADQTLFQDYAHTNPAGDARIAEAYEQFILDREML